MDKMMYYIKLRSRACIIELQTGQFHRNNIQELVNAYKCTKFQLLIAYLLKRPIAGVFYVEP